MHKILYFTYGYYYSLFKEELFKTNFFAWQYGPVDTTIYNSTYKKNKYKLNYLKDDLKNQDKNKNKQAKIFLNQNKKKELDKIINFLINKSSFDFVSDSHKTKPWILTNINNRIENTKINDYFSQKNNQKYIQEELKKIKWERFSTSKMF